MKVWVTLGVMGAIACGLPVGVASADPATQPQAFKDYQAADKELNGVYQSLTQNVGMPAATKRQLVTAQLAWLKFRDAEAAFALAYADGDRPVARLRRLSELTRERTKALWAYLNEANGD